MPAERARAAPGRPVVARRREQLDQRPRRRRPRRRNVGTSPGSPRSRPAGAAPDLAADREGQRAGQSGSRSARSTWGARARRCSASSSIATSVASGADRPRAPIDAVPDAEPLELARGRRSSSRADRVPDGLQLEERRDVVQRLAVRACRATTRLTFSAAAISRSVRRPSAPVRSIAFTSMWLASHGASSARWPGEQVDDASRDVARRDRLGQLDRRERLRLGGERDDGVAAGERRREPRDEAEQRRVVGRDDGDDAGRLRDREVEVRPGDRVRRAEHLRELVGEARVPDPAVDRALDLVLYRCRARRTPGGAPPSSRRSGRAPARGCTPSPTPHFACAPRAA